MAALTKEEKAWVSKVNKLLAACPSKRLGFATMGDCDVRIFDVRRYADIDEALNRSNGDFIPTAGRLGALFDEALNFPNPVESTAG